MSLIPQLRALIRFHTFGNPALMIFAIVGMSQLPVLFTIGRTLKTLTVNTGYMPPVTAAIGLLIILSLLIMFVAGPAIGRLNMGMESQSLGDIEDFLLSRAVPPKLLSNFRMALVVLFILLLALLVLTIGGTPETVQFLTPAWPAGQALTTPHYVEWHALVKPLTDTFGSRSVEGPAQPLKLAHHLWAFQLFQALTLVVVGSFSLLLASWPALRNVRGALAVAAFAGLAIVPTGLYFGAYALAVAMAGPLAPIRWIAQAPVASVTAVALLLAGAVFVASKRLQNRSWLG